MFEFIELVAVETSLYSLVNTELGSELLIETLIIPFKVSESFSEKFLCFDSIHRQRHILNAIQIVYEQ